MAHRSAKDPPGFGSHACEKLIVAEYALAAREVRRVAKAARKKKPKH